MLSTKKPSAQFAPVAPVSSLIELITLCEVSNVVLMNCPSRDILLVPLVNISKSKLCHPELLNFNIPTLSEPPL